ncbi:hypothetical protein [Kaarinaea lacus]
MLTAGKNTSFVAGFLVLFMHNSGVSAEKHPWQFKTPFETAVIEYKLSGSQSGKETLYISEHGNKRVKISRTSSKLGILTTKTNRVEIVTQEHITNVDMDKGVASVKDNPLKALIDAYLSLPPQTKKIIANKVRYVGVDFADISKLILVKNADSHLGYICDEVLSESASACVFSGTPIALIKHSRMMGFEVTTTATKIKQNVEVDPLLFQIPDEMQVNYDVEANERNKVFANELLQALLTDEQPSDKYIAEQRDSREFIREAQISTVNSNAIDKQKVAGQDPNGHHHTTGQNQPANMEDVVRQGATFLKGLF